MADPGFSPGGAPTPKIAIIFHIFAENCMKMKEFGPPGGGASLAPPLGSANGIVLLCLMVHFLSDESRASDSQEPSQSAQRIQLSRGPLTRHGRLQRPLRG